MKNQYDHCFHNQSGFERINFTFECFNFKLFTDFKFSLLSLIFFFIISLDISINLIVLISILFEKNKKRVDICFMSNAISDLIMGLVIMPFTALYTLFGHFPLGHYTCFIWNCLDFTAGTVSMLHIAYISYDRYLSVSKPLKYTQKSNDKFSVTGIPTYLILGFIWFFSAAAWIPVILYLKSKNQNPNEYFLSNNNSSSIRFFNNKTFKLESSAINYEITEFNNNNNNNQYQTYKESILADCNVETTPSIIVPHSLIVYFLPMFFIFLFYSKTIIIVRKKIKKRRSSSASSRVNVSLFHSFIQASLNLNNNNNNNNNTNRDQDDNNQQQHIFNPRNSNAESATSNQSRFLEFKSSIFRFLRYLCVCVLLLNTSKTVYNQNRSDTNHQHHHTDGKKPRASNANNININNNNNQSFYELSISCNEENNKLDDNDQDRLGNFELQPKSQQNDEGYLYYQIKKSPSTDQIKSNENYLNENRQLRRISSDIPIRNDRNSLDKIWTINDHNANNISDKQKQQDRMDNSLTVNSSTYSSEKTLQSNHSDSNQTNNNKPNVKLIGKKSNSEILNDRGGGINKEKKSNKLIIDLTEISSFNNNNYNKNFNENQTGLLQVIPFEILRNQPSAKFLKVTTKNNLINSSNTNLLFNNSNLTKSFLANSNTINTSCLNLNKSLSSTYSAAAASAKVATTASSFILNDSIQEKEKLNDVCYYSDEESDDETDENMNSQNVEHFKSIRKRDLIGVYHLGYDGNELEENLIQNSKRISISLDNNLNKIRFFDSIIKSRDDQDSLINLINKFKMKQKNKNFFNQINLAKSKLLFKSTFSLSIRKISNKQKSIDLNEQEIKQKLFNKLKPLYSRRFSDLSRIDSILVKESNNTNKTTKVNEKSNLIKKNVSNEPTTSSSRRKSCINSRSLGIGNKEQSYKRKRARSVSIKEEKNLNREKLMSKTENRISKNGPSNTTNGTSSNSNNNNNNNSNSNCYFGILKKKTSIRDSNLGINKNLSFNCTSYGGDKQLFNSDMKTSPLNTPKIILTKASSNSSCKTNQITTTKAAHTNYNNNSERIRKSSHLSLPSSLGSNVSSASKRERNVTYKLGFIMLTFLISWLPFCLFWPLVSICSTCISESLYVFSFWLAYLNSIFTPLILLYNNKKYRRSIYILKNFICSPFCNNKDSINPHSIIASHYDPNSFLIFQHSRSFYNNNNSRQNFYNSKYQRSTISPSVIVGNENQEAIDIDK